MADLLHVSQPYMYQRLTALTWNFARFVLRPRYSTPRRKIPHVHIVPLNVGQHSWGRRQASTLPNFVSFVVQAAFNLADPFG
jgi:hypothetical protein